MLYCIFFFVLHVYLKLSNIQDPRERHGGDRMVVGLQLPVQLGPVTTKIASFNTVHGNMIKFVSNLRQVRGFLLVFWFPPPIKLTATI